MHAKSRLVILTLIGLPLGVAAMGSTCSPNVNPQAIGTVDMKFLNDTPFDVNAFVNGQLITTIPAGQLAPVFTLDCSPGIRLNVDGEMITPNGVFQSVNSVFFDEGVHFACGGSLLADYTRDVDRNLVVQGTVTQQ